MREVELNAIFNLVTEPEKNFVNINNRKVCSEVERIVRIIDLTKKQKQAQRGLQIRNLTSFNLVQSYN